MSDGSPAEHAATVREECGAHQMGMSRAALAALAVLERQAEEAEFLGGVNKALMPYQERAVHAEARVQQLEEGGGMSAALLNSRRGRIFFIHVPILVSGLIVASLFSAVARDWTERQTLGAGAVLAVVWSAFVLAPLLILVAPIVPGGEEKRQAKLGGE